MEVMEQYHYNWMIFVMYVSIETYVTTFHINVYVETENGTIEDLTEDYYLISRQQPRLHADGVMAANVFVRETMEKPLPFNVTEPDIKANVHGWKGRYKRSITDRGTSSGFVRTLPECQRNMDMIRKKAKNKPIQLAYIVEVGEDVKMTCHFCGDQTVHQGIVRWMRMGRTQVAGKTGAYNIDEVQSDMHDDDRRNRVIITDDLTLLIENVTEKDAGAYFCQDTRKDNKTMDSITKKKMETFFSSKERFRFFYHLDIVLPSKIPVKRVSEDSKDYPKPAVEVADKESNLIYYTDWANYSVCSVCGEPGEQKKHGTCMAKLYKDKMMDPPYMYYILSSYRPGLPCRSTLYTDYPKIKPRPDEIEFRICNISCGLARGRRRMSADLGGLGWGRFAKKIPEKRLRVTVGRTVAMMCPGSSLDTMVYWMNGSVYMPAANIREETETRVEIDAYNVLRIHTTRFSDIALYTCWYGGKERIRFDLMVVSRRGEEPWILHLRHLGYTCVFDFAIFIALLFVKHKNRQALMKYKELKETQADLAENVIESQAAAPERKSDSDDDYSSEMTASDGSYDSSTSSE